MSRGSSSALGWRFGNIVGSEFENEIHIFKGDSMKAMQARYLRMTPKVHVLVYHVQKYVCCPGVSLEPTPVQALVSQHTLFDSFYHRFEANCAKSLVFEDVYLTLCNIIIRAIFMLKSWLFIHCLPNINGFGQLGVDKLPRIFSKRKLLRVLCS